MQVMMTTSDAERPRKRLAAALSATLVATASIAAADTAAAFEMPSRWVSAHFRDNPLVGTIHAGDGTPVEPAALAGAIAASDYVLAGETHDNADHHRLQARIVEAMTAAGDRPAIVFEMIPTDLQPALDAYLAAPSPSVEGFGTAVAWSERGWPDIAIYRPVVEAALAAKLAIRAGDLPREAIRRIGRDGAGALAPAEVDRLSLGTAMPQSEVEELSETLAASHCGMLPAKAIAPMLTVQRARDGALVDATMTAAREAGGGKAVLVAGSGHVRGDWAVPALIEAREEEARIISIAMMEVSDGEESPADYGLGTAEPAPYDYIIFTPRGDISDPCEGLAEAIGAKKPGE